MVVCGALRTQELTNWERVKASAFVGLDDLRLERCDGYGVGVGKLVCE